MVVRIINLEKDSEWSEILKRMEIYARSNEIEASLVTKTLPETKGIIIEEIIFNLLMGVSVNAVYDLLKMVVKNCRKEKEDVIRNIKIETEDGDTRKTIEVSEILRKDE